VSRGHRSAIKRDATDAKKAARTRAIELQFASTLGVPREPVKPASRPGTYNPPGYYRRGNLKGVIYTTHIGHARA
jgi:hypothetical protein